MVITPQEASHERTYILTLIGLGVGLVVLLVIIGMIVLRFVVVYKS